MAECLSSRIKFQNYSRLDPEEGQLEDILSFADDLVPYCDEIHCIDGGVS